ncbi:MAG: glycosyltransferase [Magnetococcales bacterium]|nr:glycosyltransferase [Magnetococcales bacterium]
MTDQTQKILIMVPTYNEKENVENLTGKLAKLHPDLDLLFIDDNSADGTGALLDRIAEGMPRLSVMHRQGKLGIGSAHQDGIAYAYDNGYDVLVTMDADLTHNPEDITRFLAIRDQYDVVVGSRFMRADSLPGWNMWRRFLTFFGHLLTTRLLGMSYDATGAFRLYNLGKVPRNLFGMVESLSYSFFFESLFRLHSNHHAIGEVPIYLPARTYGKSKICIADIIRSVRFLFSMAHLRFFESHRLIYVEPIETNALLPDSPTREEWDAYWSRKSHSGKWLYNLIAAFYRKILIRPTLNHFIDQTFSPQSKLLHAGCGSGAVDVDMCLTNHVTALDISPIALLEYAMLHASNVELVHGSVFEIPAEEGAYDGIFNLGVMEHFYEPDVIKILQEFNRVLKPGGRVVLFWPPAYGLSVRVLKGVHYVLHNWLKSDIQLHPAELTHVTSREITEGWMQASGFLLTEYYFGIRDFYTHQVVVAEKVRDIEPEPESPPVQLNGEEVAAS